MFDLLAELSAAEVTEALAIARDSHTTAGALAALYGDPADPMFQHVTAVPTLPALCAALVHAIDAADPSNEAAVTAIFAEIRRMVVPDAGHQPTALHGSHAGLWRLH